MNNYPETGEQFPEQNDRIVNQFSLHPSDPAFLQAWGFMENQQMPASIESLFGFSNAQATPDFMSFGQNQSWFCM